jgi:hypothetical protein
VSYLGNSTSSGLPTAGGVASLAPLPVQDFGALPSVDPSYATAYDANPASAGAATVDPSQNPAYMQAEYAQTAAALQPQFAQQQSDLQDSSAARGISNSGAAGQLQGNLLGQQASALSAAEEPITAQGYSYEQADITQNQANQQATGLANAGFVQQANLANAGANTQNSQYNAGVGNTAAQENANYYAGALGTNASNYNNYLNTIEQQGYNTANEGYGAYLNSFLPNSGVQTTISGAESGANNAYNTAYGGAQAGANAALGAAGSAFGGFSSSAPAAAAPEYGGLVGDTSGANFVSSNGYGY